MTTLPHVSRGQFWLFYLAVLLGLAACAVAAALFLALVSVPDWAVYAGAVLAGLTFAAAVWTVRPR